MSSQLQHIRQQHGYSMVDVAVRTGIPVRDIAAAEHGLRRFDANQLAQISALYNLPISQLTNTIRTRSTRPFTVLFGIGAMFILTSAFIMLGGTLTVMSMPATRTMMETRVVSQPADSVIGSSSQLRQRLLRMGLGEQMAQEVIAEDSETSNLVDSPITETEAFRPLAAIASKRGLPGAPFGCPVQPMSGRVVMTQGYGVGTHAPTAIWGAVDLAVDGDGDGYAEPSATIGTPVVALHGGIAKVVPNNWLAGNYVRISDDLNGWATAYAHLDSLNITHEQRIEPGMIIGWVGTTGYSSGPHLHYEVYQNDININPLSILECW
ncbi:MAG: peptidoglycan DD-metalloendopeptidase family protein [Roseiflexaceae bacterium]